ncbi:Hpt domain-containing protein [Maricaulis sp.]|uniref:Hpt domain-containing protein n=1 Tax=Maricaulis sp. TaxID=1486257 RepID=UPI003A90B7F7
MGAEVMAGQIQDWRQQTVIDTATIDALVAAVGPEVFDQLKAQFAADLRSLTAACHDAGCAGNQALVREKAHALRGAALNIGLSRLGHLAGALERGETADAAELQPVLDGALSALLAAGKP